MTIVMTGGTRGLGRVAAMMLTAPGMRIMGARDVAAVPSGWTGHPLDLGNLASVRAFAASLPAMPITHLILNAGGQSPTVHERTVDGYERTFASNHLAHYLLLRLLMPRLAAGARIVLTASGTHDPREKTGVPPPRHADAQLLAHPERDPGVDRRDTVAGMRAYASSKLCNVMTARYLADSRDAREGGWRVHAYDPGLTPGTGLVRHQSWPVRKLIWPLLPLFVPFAKGMNTLTNAGRGLAELATTAVAPPGLVYAALRRGKLTWPLPSELARNDAAVHRLWEDSAELVGVA